ncbi:nSTAND1 domain-containing NTPase [Falsiroseomonas ponticola]|uniref:nSTAND1 domain-containing NTPase n=1 Tax=Falsiroseomonas ponticola TaxID=2786951 RepID=UPI0019338E7F|nr:ATP-binding protein [Roseomonas ponticola]
MSSTTPTLHEIENAFQPAKEISDIERFAGRAKPVTEAFLALLASGANLAIVGNRGIGKTSLARQIQNFGRGDNGLIQKLAIGLDHVHDFNVMYFACGTGVDDRDALLARLLTSDNCLGPWLYDVPKNRRLINALSPKLSAKIFGVGAEVGTSQTIDETRELVVVPQVIEGIFENVVRNLVEQRLTRDGVLIVIDEFDQIKDPAGIGPFLKAMATNTENVKFCIIGVAADIQELMREHESADRLFAGTIIALDPMSGNELSEIIKLAEEKIHNYIKFSDAAQTRLVELAQGHPYLVHLVGKFAFRDAYRNNKHIIESQDIDLVLQSIAENGSDPVLEGRYRKAVASSRQREIVLKALAANQDDRGEIWTTNAYKEALEKGVDNSSQYVGQLVTEEFGAEIERVRERYYRFKDSLFCAYVKARPSMRGLARDS